MAIEIDRVMEAFIARYSVVMMTKKTGEEETTVIFYITPAGEMITGEEMSAQIKIQRAGLEKIIADSEKA